ncbi:hypothetical protein [Sneathiella glossodoripedis]|uniref:hypothetical protein n=1 Tax=Sneathiella glossodoripedis TaxID=418853 RepID=UPI000472E015|nr:hypothetical protein [Sneathiella glossodoripedis]
MQDCHIVNVTTERNGNPRYWCKIHFANATAPGGKALQKCLKSNASQTRETEKLFLDPETLPGGIALWGALQPVYDTTNQNPVYGVHVHARETKEKNSKKIIDATFKQVDLKVGRDLLGDQWETITDDAAIAYFNTLAAGFTPSSICCKHCKRLHLDEGRFSVSLHTKHQCQYCGRDFFDTCPSIGNPIASIKKVFDDLEFERPVEKSKEIFCGRQSDFKGGVKIWASNPAAFWTQPWPELSGIHFHGFDEDGNRVIDETFGNFSLDGVTFSRKCMRVYMAQLQIPELSKKVKSIYCPKCHAPHFENTANAFTPHVEHECDACGFVFSENGEKILGNPIVEQLQQLTNTFRGTQS